MIGDLENSEYAVRKVLSAHFMGGFFCLNNTVDYINIFILEIL